MKVEEIYEETKSLYFITGSGKANLFILLFLQKKSSQFLKKTLNTENEPILIQATNNG